MERLVRPVRTTCLARSENSSSCSAALGLRQRRCSRRRTSQWACLTKCVLLGEKGSKNDQIYMLSTTRRSQYVLLRRPALSARPAQRSLRYRRTGERCARRGGLADILRGARRRAGTGRTGRGGLPGGLACTRARRAEERHTPARPRATARISARGRWGTPANGVQEPRRLGPVSGAGAGRGARE